MKTYFDSDKVEILKLSELFDNYPKLLDNKFRDDIYFKSWNINKIPVIALNDANLFMKLFKDDIVLNDINYTDVAICSVCRKVLLPDDECYEDNKTGDSLCTEHSFYDDVTGYYHKKIF